MLFILFEESFLFYLKRAPNKSRIADWVMKFETCGTVPDLHTKSEDRPSHSGPSQLLWSAPATLDRPSHSGVPATLDRPSHSGPSQPLWTVPATLDRPSHSGPSQPLWTVPATLDRPSHSGPSQPLWTTKNPFR